MGERPKKHKRLAWETVQPISKLFAIALLCFWLVGCSSQFSENLLHTADSEISGYSHNEPINTQHGNEYASFEQRVFERINNERTAHGIAPLVWDNALANVARSHSRNMAQLNFFDFTCPAGLSPSERITNAGVSWLLTHTFIMSGNRLTPESLSLPDDDVLLNEALTHVGIGFYRSADSLYERYFTIEFITMPIRPCDETMREWERFVLDLTNEYRARYGLPALIWNDTLAQAARLHSADMAYNDFIAHEGSDGSDIGERITRVGWEWRIVKENVAVGQETPDIVVNGWINSPGHRANILSEDIRYLGVGFYFLEGSQAHFHWTQKFGTPMPQ